MANFWYTQGLAELLKGTVDLDTGGSDIRFILCMSNTTATTEGSTGVDAATVSAITLDEYDGTGYPNGTFANRPALAGEAVTADATNNRGVFDATDYTITALGVATRSTDGILIYQHNTSDADSIPLIWLDFVINGWGGDVTINWNALGLGYLQG